MPNGKHGDHPYTDILLHGSSEFGEPVDGLVKVLSKLPGFPQYRKRCRTFFGRIRRCGAKILPREGQLLWQDWKP
jgi:hypothetical protein